MNKSINVSLRMHRTIKYVLLTGIVSILLCQKASAQCTQSLNSAEDEYESGRLLDIPSMLAFCLNRNGFSKEEKIRAYKLLTKVYIFSDEEEKAEESLVLLLKADPEHELNNLFDPAELFYLYNKFRVKPVFRLALKLGANFSSANVIDEFSTYTFSDGAREYTSQLGFNAELTIERHITNGLEIAAGLQYSATKFTVQEEFVTTDISFTVNETQSWLKVPVFARYNFFYESNKNFLPYVLGGFSTNLLSAAQFVDSERRGGTQRSVNGYDLLTDNERNRLNFSLFFGGGLKIRTNRVNFFTVEARYEAGLLNYVNSEHRFINSASTFGLSYVPDNLSLNFLSVSLGYTHSIYNPKKKRNANKQ
ncbi:MAG: porin family protein [Cyclobacteriaceae bacterium]